MRILMQCYEYPPLGGGGSRAVEGLSRALARAGHEVDVVTMGFRGLPRSETVDGVRIHRVPCLRARAHLSHPWEMASYLASALPVSTRLVRRRRHALSHTHFLFPDGVLSRRVRRRTGLPYVVTAHGSDVPGYNPDRFGLAHRLLAPLWRRVVDDAAHVILPSQSLESLFLEHSRKPERSRITYGIEPSHFCAGESRRPRILVVTRMFERKGVQYVLRALAGRSLDHEVHVVGDGPYLPTLRELAAREQLDVRFWGWLENDSPELAELYRSSRIFVFTSEAENFPVGLLEAMSAGLAIITTKATGCEEVVGDAALLVPARNVEAIRAALGRLLDDPALCESLGRRARERAEREFSWDAVARRHVDLYERVCGRA